MVQGYASVTLPLVTFYFLKSILNQTHKYGFNQHQKYRLEKRAMQNLQLNL